METEVRFYYSKDSKDKIISFIKSFNELDYKGKFYEITDQYNHPMEKYNFYSKEIDGRFRVRKIVGENTSKCMITWKKRLNKNQLIHTEEEIELQIKPEEYDNLCLLLNNVLHLNIVESYERYRNIFQNNEVEIVVDEYPFGTCVEIENKSTRENPKNVVNRYIKLLKFDINRAYNLSWDDKYEELCKKQNISVNKIVRFNDIMPDVEEKF